MSKLKLTPFMLSGFKMGIEEDELLRGVSRNGEPVVFCKKSYYALSDGDVLEAHNIGSNRPGGRPRNGGAWSKEWIFLHPDPKLRYAIIKLNKGWTWDQMMNVLDHNHHATFIFKSYKDYITSVKKLKEHVQHYKYGNLTRHKDNAPDPSRKEHFIFTMTLSRIEEVHSILNPKKVDGLCINIEVLDASSSKYNGRLTPSRQICLTLSNHLENIFYIDGITTMPANKVKNMSISAYTDDLIYYVNNVMNPKQEKVVKERKSKVSKSSGSSSIVSALKGAKGRISQIIVEDVKIKITCGDITTTLTGVYNGYTYKGKVKKSTWNGASLSGRMNMVNDIVSKVKLGAKQKIEKNKKKATLKYDTGAGTATTATTYNGTWTTLKIY